MQVRASRFACSLCRSGLPPACPEQPRLRHLAVWSSSAHAPEGWPGRSRTRPGRAAGCVCGEQTSGLARNAVAWCMQTTRRSQAWSACSRQSLRRSSCTYQDVRSRSRSASLCEGSAWRRWSWNVPDSALRTRGIADLGPQHNAHHPEWELVALRELRGSGRLAPDLGGTTRVCKRLHAWQF